MDNKSFSIVGSGVLAKTFGALLVETDKYELQYVVGRNASSIESCTDFIGDGKGSQDFQDLAGSDLLILAVPDDALRECARRLSESKSKLKAEMVVHFSGAYSSSILEELASSSRSIGSLHPLRSFPEPLSSIAEFSGTNCALEGSTSAVEYMQRLLKLIEGNSFNLQETDKLQYHAAAVFASNYIVTVLKATETLLEDLGLGDKFVLFEDLVSNATRQVFSSSPQEALTGPIQRGDSALVRDQLRAISHLPEIQSSYRELGLQAARIIKEKGDLKESELEEILKALSEQSG